MQTINDITYMTPRGCEITLDFTPKSSAYTYTAGVTTYNPVNTYWAVAQQTLTFTYTARFSDPNCFVTEARWDFGDRTHAYGTTVQHAYKIGNPHTQVGLQLRDNYGNYFYARKLVPVRIESLVVLIPSITGATA